MNDPEPVADLPSLSPQPASFQTKGFLGKLFDFSFDQFITISLIRFLYGLLMLATALYTLAFIAFTAQLDLVIAGVIGAPFMLLLGLIMARVYCEFMFVIFRIAENTGETARNTRH